MAKYSLDQVKKNIFIQARSCENQNNLIRVEITEYYTGRVKNKNNLYRAGKWKQEQFIQGGQVKISTIYTGQPSENKNNLYRAGKFCCCHNKAIKTRLPPRRVGHWRSPKHFDPGTQYSRFPSICNIYNIHNIHKISNCLQYL